MIRAVGFGIFIAPRGAEYVCNSPFFPLPIFDTRMWLRNMRQHDKGFPGDR